MNRKLRPPLRMPWALFACCAAIAAVVGVEWTRFAGAAPQGELAPPPAAASAKAEIATFVPPPETHFAEIAERPLFIPERRPQQDIEPQKAAPPPNAPAVIVQGVVLESGRHYAIIQHIAPPKLEELSEGAIVDGWQIESIAADHVSLRAGTQQMDLPVGKPKANAGPGAPVSQRPDRRPAALRALDAE